MDHSNINHERIREALAVVTRLYEDARARADVIRGVALAAMGVLSVLTALTDLKTLAGLHGWAVPAVVLAGIGLVCALAVLLKTPVMVPYDSRVVAATALDSGLVHDPTGAMLTAITEAEVYTRTYNNRAALLVNITLSTFVAAVLVLVFQVAIGPRAGIVVGSVLAVTIVAAAFLVRRLAFVMPAKKGTEDE